MKCQNCQGELGSTRVCRYCGTDNSQVDYAAVRGEFSPAMRSTRITIYMSIVILMDLLLVGIAIFGLIGGNPAERALSIIFLVLGLLDIIFAINVMRMKRRALYAYIGLAAVGAIFSLLRLDFVSVLIKALVLYFIFKNDWEYFG